MASVYLETSIIGYLASHPGADIIFAANQLMTTEWWNALFAGHLHAAGDTKCLMTQLSWKLENTAKNTQPHLATISLGLLPISNRVRVEMVARLSIEHHSKGPNNRMHGRPRRRRF
jgi:hypothetical protein